MSRPVYIDIDGTLTRDPEKMWGPPNLARIAEVHDRIRQGQRIVIWSGNGGKYAKEFAETYGLRAIAIGKPSLMVDDNPDVSPSMEVVSPETYFEA